MLKKKLNIFFVGLFIMIALAEGASRCEMTYGGRCQSTRTCPNIFIHYPVGLCPGSSSIKCCIDAYPCSGSTGLDEFDKHINKIERLALVGYQPTSGSGVTIASGYDLGHGPDIKICIGGSGSSLYQKIRPYRGLKTVAAVKAKGLRASNLRVTVAEARKIDCCLKSLMMKSISRYDDNMSVCGKTVLASLVTWCGASGAKTGGPGRKCGYPSGSPRLGQVGRVMVAKGTDSDLLVALKTVKGLHISYGKKSWMINRVAFEINYLADCMSRRPTPPPPATTISGPGGRGNCVKNFSAFGGRCSKIMKCTDLSVYYPIGLCPGQPNDVKCCVRVDACSGQDGLDRFDRHINRVERLSLIGYQPTSQSGVTIATGYDLGYGPGIRTCLGGSSTPLYSKLRPYFGLRSTAAVAAMGLKADNLKAWTSLKHA